MAKNLDEWQVEAEEWLETARQQLGNRKLSRADREKLRRDITKTQQLLDDLPQVKRLVEAGVPLAEIKMPPPTIKTRGRRDEYLRANLSRWQKKQREAAIEAERQKRKELEEAVAQGKLAPDALKPKPRGPQRDVVRETSRRVATEMKREMLEHRRLFGRPPDWANRRLQEYQARLQEALGETLET